MSDRIHLIDPDAFVRLRKEWPWCGHGRYVTLVEDPSEATCQHCLRRCVRFTETVERQVMSGAPSRPSWHDYFLEIARAVSRRADCTRAQHGAVIVDTDRRIVATGYNGSPPGGPSCLAGECPRGQLSRDQEPGVSLGGSGSQDYSNCHALHAETNAIANADPRRCAGATIYVTGVVCDMDRKLIRAARIAKVIYLTDYSYREEEA